MKINYKSLDHIQICIPNNEEQRAREFYCDLLGMKEIEKPEALKKNGGFWLQLNGFQIHIGIEDNIQVCKRHLALEVTSLSKVRRFLEENGVKTQSNGTIPGVDRFSLFDPWDNRIEFLEKHNPQFSI